MGMMNKLSEMLASAPVGSGMAKQASDVLRSRAYQLHVQEAQANGEKPMTAEQWAAAQRG